MKHQFTSGRFTFIRTMRAHFTHYLGLYQIALVLCLCALLALALSLTQRSAITRVTLLVAGTGFIVLLASRGLRDATLRVMRGMAERVRRSPSGRSSIAHQAGAIGGDSALEAWDKLVTYLHSHVTHNSSIKKQLTFARQRLIRHASPGDSTSFAEIALYFRNLPRKKQTEAVMEWVKTALPPADALWSFDTPVPLLFMQWDKLYWKGVNVARTMPDVIWWQPFDRTVKTHRVLWDAAIALHQANSSDVKRKNSASSVTFGEWRVSDDQCVMQITKKTNSETVNYE